MIPIEAMSDEVLAHMPEEVIHPFKCAICGNVMDSSDYCIAVAQDWLDEDPERWDRMHTVSNIHPIVHGKHTNVPFMYTEQELIEMGEYEDK